MLNTTYPISIVIADDHQMLLLMYKATLEQHGMKVIGECKNPDAVVEMYKEMRPNVVLLDIRFGTAKSGLDALKEIIEFDKMANVVIISQNNYGPYIKRAFQYGARAFLDKDSDPEMLVTAVKAASAGKSFHPPSVTEKVMDMLSNPEPDPITLLSDTDFQIFLYLAQGKTNSEIAELINVNVSYVTNHRVKIQTILQIDRQPLLSILAMKLGYLTPDGMKI